MDLPRLLSRRRVLALSIVVALSRVMPVKAQWTNGCEYGITNGLVTIGGEDCGIGVPQHMVDATNNSFDDDDNDGTVNSNVQSPNEIRSERLQDRRDHTREKRGRRTDQKQTQRNRRHEQKILCEDFSSQFQAVEAMAQNPWAAKKLDPNGDGVPCEDLRALTCDEFDDPVDATNWFNRMGYSAAYDPFKLYDAETGGVCTVRGICSAFRSQKEAVEWLTDHPKDASRLDPDGDGAPCANLSAVTCKAFTTQDEAKQWFNRNGFIIATRDPYKLYDAELGEFCPKRGTCDDFSTQKAAVEWLTDHPKDKSRLDPDDDGAPCAKLPTVTCKSFSNQQEATNWFNTNKFVKTTRDPYHLYDDETGSICPTKVTCADFTTQKAAVEWMKDHPKDKARLDENGDGIACPKLPQWSCSSFKSSKEAREWHEHYKPTNAFWDPYGLYNENADPKRYCSNLPLTTNG